MKRVGIVTWFCTPNFGSQLQAYAMNSVLRSLGYLPEFLIFVNHELVHKVLSFVSLFSIYKTNYYKFCKKHLRIKTINPNKYQSISDNYCAMICGSDQIWAPNVFNPHYYLSFVPDSIPMISYSTSIGLDYIPDNLIENYRKYVGRLSHVSVREERGKELLSSIGLASEVTIDPTFLIPAKEWRKLKDSSYLGKRYVFCYFLNEKHQYKRLINKITTDNVPIIGVSYNKLDTEWMECLDINKVGPEQFLGLIDNAEMVITDSYHGTIFSLLFHKKFVTIERFSNEDAVCQNSRIRQLKKYFEIDGLIVNSSQDTIGSIESIDYIEFENRLSSLRKKSMSYLINALK